MAKSRLPLVLIALCLTSAPAEAQPDHAAPAPDVDMTALRTVAPGILVAPDRRLPLVPNIGIVEGQNAILVVDTGLGPTNGARVYAAALRVARGRKIYLTTTHFHPEHSYGASAFPPGSLIMNAAQAAELRDKGPGYLERFRQIGPAARAALAETQLIDPAIIYRGRRRIDLGGVKVELREVPAHTRGDQVIFVPSSHVLFTGDLAETRFFPVLIDQDSKGSGWIEALRYLSSLHPAIIVPGHGEITTGKLLGDVRTMLQWMRSAVRERVARGVALDEITAEVQSECIRRFPDWDNGRYLHYDVASFYGEALADQESGRSRH